MNRNFANELSTWLPRLSGAAFKCLFVIYLELAVAGTAEVVISRRRFIDVTGLSKSAVTGALVEIAGRRAVVRRSTTGGGFAYSIPGLIIERVENKPVRKSSGIENQSPRPKDLFDLFLWHWQNRFGGRAVAPPPPSARDAIIGQLQQFSYKYLFQSLKGLATLDDFDVIDTVLNPETTLKAVRRGHFLYFNWRDARAGGDL